MRLVEYIEAMSGIKVWVKALSNVSLFLFQKVYFLQKLACNLMLAVCLFYLQVSVNAMFDVQIKRIHEYKRQFLNILGIIHRYDCIKVSGIFLGKRIHYVQKKKKNSIKALAASKNEAILPRLQLNFFHEICVPLPSSHCCTEMH